MCCSLDLHDTCVVNTIILVILQKKKPRQRPIKKLVLGSGGRIRFTEPDSRAYTLLPKRRRERRKKKREENSLRQITEPFHTAEWTNTPSLQYKQPEPHHSQWPHSYHIQEGHSSTVQHQAVDWHFGDIHFNREFRVPVHLNLNFFGWNINFLWLFNIFIRFKSIIWWTNITYDPVLTKKTPPTLLSIIQNTFHQFTPNCSKVLHGPLRKPI